MKRICISLLLILTTLTTTAQTDTLRGHWVCKSEGVHLYLDLAEETLTVPFYEFLGPVNGYLRGGLSEMWFLTTFKQEGEKEWTLRFSNESGADTQEMRLLPKPDGSLQYKAVGSNQLRRAVRRKWVYLPETMTFEPVQKN